MLEAVGVNHDDDYVQGAGRPITKGGTMFLQAITFDHRWCPRDHGTQGCISGPCR